MLCSNQNQGSLLFTTSDILVYSPLGKFFDIVVFNEGVSVYQKARSHIFPVSAQFIVTSLNKNLLRALHTYMYNIFLSIFTDAKEK